MILVSGFVYMENRNVIEMAKSTASYGTLCKSLHRSDIVKITLIPR